MAQYDIEGNPDYGQLTVTLAPGEAFVAEAGSMAWMSDGMNVRARLLGGLFKALLRKSAVVNRCSWVNTATNEAGL